MIILGIDTSGYVNAVGVTDGHHVMADNRFPARTDTLEQIVDNIDVTLKQAGITLKDVEGIGVGLGPGSWTGIKVGVTVGKMLAFSSGKPVAGICTLDALAYSVRQESLPVYTVISAGVKDMVYAARYGFKENEPVREGEYYAGDIRGLGKIINQPFVLAGQNATYYGQILSEENEPVGTGVTTRLTRLSIKKIENEPAGASIAFLAGIRFSRGQQDNPLSLTPMYLKESTAKVFVNKYQKKDD
jgi:tRNA threonylcarbamoyladenosine biosynthesis protein TsaB